MCDCQLSLVYKTSPFSLFFFFNDTATTEIYTLSLHDALPICIGPVSLLPSCPASGDELTPIVIDRLGSSTDTTGSGRGSSDRKSTRLNSSHSQISYAVFCLKKKKKHNHSPYRR